MRWLAVAGTVLVLAPAASAQQTVGRKAFETRCARCHGIDGKGGERGPDIYHSESAKTRSQASIAELIRTGVPAAGMPAFQLAQPELLALAGYVKELIAPAADHPTPGDTAAGARYFWDKGACWSCHMVAGRGSVNGPDLTELAKRRSLPEIELKLARPEADPSPGYQVISVRSSRDGSVLRGFARNESAFDIQLQDSAGRFHSIRRSDVAGITRETSPMPRVAASAAESRDLLAYLTRLAGTGRAKVEWTPANPSFKEIADPRPGDWPSYNGRLSGNRHSALDQINKSNVASLASRWSFPIPNASRLEVTPVVVDGIMYVTTANQAFALDAATGREFWHYIRPRTKGLVGDAAGGINRGIAVLGDRLFMVTDHAHLIALNRITGGLVWETVMDDYRKHYGATSAPLVVNDLVISGTSGGDEGARGFVAAYRASTGEEVWRFRVAPAPGEPKSETWVGRALEHGCGAAWLTGTFDPETGLLYWPTGNPCPDYNGDERKGDNLYTSSVLALEPANGRLAWYYQFTPHDLHDWDATETPMLVNAAFGGRDRKLLIHADRNGFFYLLDRITGELLLAKPFVQNLTWASGVGADGRPQLLPGAEPSIEGTRTCPAVEGATNWMSSGYSAATGLFYVMALEKCNIYSKSSAWWERGKSFYGGATRDIPGEPGRKYLRAIDIQSGKVAWEVPQLGTAESWGGALSTAGGLVFFGDDAGAFAAVDATDGKPLWHFNTSERWKASPMTYLAGKLSSTLGS